MVRGYAGYLIFWSTADFLAKLINDMSDDEMPSSILIKHSQKRTTTSNLVIQESFLKFSFDFNFLSLIFAHFYLISTYLFFGSTGSGSVDVDAQPKSLKL